MQCQDEDRFKRILEYADLDSDKQDAFKAFLDVTCDSEEAFAEHLCDELCMFDNVPESVSRFFDYTAFASEIFMSDYDIGDDSHVFRTY